MIFSKHRDRKIHANHCGAFTSKQYLESCAIGPPFQWVCDVRYEINDTRQRTDKNDLKYEGKQHTLGISFEAARVKYSYCCTVIY